jgi:Mg2+/Co2+ transporter CorB
MDDIALTALLAALAVLLVVSGAFSLAETAMMAANRYRLRHQAQRGSRGAKLALSLLAQTDRLLGVILLGNNLINAAAATLTGVITVRLFGSGEWQLAAGTVVVTFLILVFSEITPKVVGAAHADRIVPLISFALAPMLKAAKPVVWFVNLFVQGLLKVLRIRPASETGATLTQEELRSLVLEGQYFRGKHRALLANLLDVGAVTVDDVMTPRSQIHALDLAEKPALIAQQLATSYHTRLPAYEGEFDQIVGILHLKQVLHLQQAGEIDGPHLRAVLRPPYFVPVGTPLLTQLQQFQSDRERLGLVVDEYGELQGLVTIEDIVEEIVGDFTTAGPAGGDTFAADADGSVVVDGISSLRTLNRRLGTEFPLDGPRTLNGLIVEHLGEIPEAGTRVTVAGQQLEILQTLDRAVKVVRLLPPVGRAPAAPLQSGNGQASSVG